MRRSDRNRWSRDDLGQPGRASVDARPSAIGDHERGRDRASAREHAPSERPPPQRAPKHAARGQRGAPPRTTAGSRSARPAERLKNIENEFALC